MFTWFTWYHWRPALLYSLWSPSGLDDAEYLNICCVGAFTRCFGSQRHNCEPGAGSLHWCHLRKPGAGAVLDQDWLWCCGCLSTGAGCLRLTVIFAAAASPGPGQAVPGRVTQSFTGRLFNIIWARSQSGAIQGKIFHQIPTNILLHCIMILVVRISYHTYNKFPYSGKVPLKIWDCFADNWDKI